METKLTQYKGIEVTIKPINHTEEDIQNELDYMLNVYPTKVETDVVENGCVTVIDFKGMKDGVAFPGGTAEGYELEIGSHSFIEGFEEKMIGMKKGETRNLDLTFPEQYPAPELAGQAVVFEVTVHEIYAKKQAELNDDFAKSIGVPGVNTVEELKEYIADCFTKTAHERTQVLAANTVMEKLIEIVECDVTKELMDASFHTKLNLFEQQLMQQGLNIERYLEMAGATMDQLAAKITEESVKQVKLDAALEKIVELEGITVSDEEVEAQFKMISEQSGFDIEEIKKELPFETVRKDSAVQKAGDLVIKSAIIKYEEA